MLVCAHAFAIDRGTAVHVDVELDLRAGLPGVAVIGLGGGPARDLRERLQAAVLNSGYGFPRRRVTVNVAPAPRRCGGELDLAVACCVLVAGGQLDRSRLERIGFCAELGLGGELRACGAGAAVADAASQAGLAGVVVATGDRESTALPGCIPVAGAGNLRDVVKLLERPSRGGARSTKPAGARTVGAPPRASPATAVSATTYCAQ
jgi:magnesium chelatase family protein